jgi:hypothetical protein
MTNDNWHTLRVPPEAYDAAKAQKEDNDRTWGEQVVRSNDSREQTRIPCGCGSYTVIYEGDQPESIDVVCPDCGNHFGYGDTADTQDLDAVIDELKTELANAAVAPNPDENLDRIGEQLERIEAAVQTAEERTGRIESTLEGLQR